MKTTETKSFDNAIDYIMTHQDTVEKEVNQVNAEFHGALGSPSWKLPTCTLQSKEIARKGYEGNSLTKAEYKDDP